MRSFFIVVSTPSVQLFGRIFKPHEPVRIQSLRAEPAIEGFDVGVIPDLDCDVQAMHQDGNFATVRSRATGTPIAPFFGVDGQCRSFDIMTIDVHKLEDDIIVRTYHLEDWAGAMRQLAGNQDIRDTGWGSDRSLPAAAPFPSCPVKKAGKAFLGPTIDSRNSLQCRNPAS